ncbi:MAG: undecaprenyl-diphosphate phosphatase [Sphaerochaetaceae bacterium]
MVENLSVWEGLLLGVIQGLAEFLPISSSGHLILFRDILSMPELPLLFDVLLHVATLLVICTYYRTLIIRLCAAFFRWLAGKKRQEDQGDLKLIGTMVVATLITVGFALVFRAIGVGDFQARTVCVMLLVTAALLASASFPKGQTGYSGFTWKQALITGIAQGFGTLSGISRSGITLTASLWSGMDRKTAGEYTFILSIPAVLGALVLSLMDFGSGSPSLPVLPVIVGCAAAFATGMAGLRLLLWMVQKARLWYFSIYLVVVGVLGLTVLF